jgi:hypothetical protein
MAMQLDGPSANRFIPICRIALRGEEPRLNAHSAMPLFYPEVHRAATIRSADRVYIFADGRLTEAARGPNCAD